MKKIMFICTGNICRSAMAHKMLEKIAEEENLDIKVYSAGIYAENGDTSTYNAIETMEEYGVDLKAHRATNVKDSEIEEMDLILCMTLSHKVSLIAMYPELKDKIYTLKEYVHFDENNKDKDISDPWGFDLETYRRCGSEIEKAVRMLVTKLKQEENEK
ncbi:MAG: low molecular weight protein arginine phosphatase [Clostridia bacterium]